MTRDRTIFFHIVQGKRPEKAVFFPYWTVRRHFVNDFHLWRQTGNVPKKSYFFRIVQPETSRKAIFFSYCTTGSNIFYTARLVTVSLDFIWRIFFSVSYIINRLLYTVIYNMNYIILVRIVLKIRIRLDAYGVSSNTDFQYNTDSYNIIPYCI